MQYQTIKHTVMVLMTATVVGQYVAPARWQTGEVFVQIVDAWESRKRRALDSNRAF